MREIAGRRVLITGGAGGLGHAMARRFAAEGAELILTDVVEATLDDMVADFERRGVACRGYVVDVTDLAAIASLRERVHAEAGPVHVLVNNAGIVHGGAFLEVPVEKHLRTYRVNVEGVVAMTHAFLPDLVAADEGHLVNVASASGFVGLPFGSTYASSKWAVLGFSESLELELDLQGHRHVHVTTVCPSYVSTGLFDGARPPLMTSLLTADRLADRIRDAVLANRRFVRTPWLVAVTPFLKGVLPFPIFYRIAAILGVSTSMTDWRGRKNA